MERFAVSDAAFGHGYLVSAGAVTPSEVTGWSRMGVGRFTYFTHPRTVVTHATAYLTQSGSARKSAVILLGHPVDVALGRTAPETLAGDLLTTLQREGIDETLRKVAYLGGRFTAFLHHGSQLTVIPDAHATQPVFWSSTGGTAIGSHAVLVARALRRPADEDALELYGGIRSIRPKGTIFMPGTTTPWCEVRPLTPNCLLRVSFDWAGRARTAHERFWPFEDRIEDNDIDHVYRRFREIFIGHIGLLSQFGRTGVSLTSGLDSRVTLAGLLQHRNRDTFTFTYANPRDIGRNAAVARDVFGASELSFRAGLQHQLIHWRTPETDEAAEHAAKFRAAYDLAWPEQQGSIGAAYAMYADLPHDFFELQSNLAETGTTHTRERTSEPISPQRLAVLWLGKAFADRAEYKPAFANYIEHADFSEDRLRGHDHHDIFYWEHRMSRWAARKFQEGDMSHRVLLPFNDRRLLETMLSLPQHMRSNKVLLKRLLDEFPGLRIGSFPDGG